jgi:hypothetical protein
MRDAVRRFGWNALLVACAFGLWAVEIWLGSFFRR